jgi:hypothetical protein
MKTFYSLLAFILAVSLYTPALAAPTLSISPTGDSTFVVQGADFQGVAGLHIIITYDTNTLANPRVNQGGLLSGMTFLPNTGKPGEIQFAGMTTNVINGSGQVATISFDLKGSPPGNIRSLSGTVLDVNGKNLNPRFIPPQQRFAAPREEEKKESEDTASSGGTPPAVSTVTPPSAMASGDTVVSRTEESHKAGAAAGAATMTGEERAETAQPSPEKKYTVLKGVIDRFRDFDGERTPKALIALVGTDKGQDYSQDPPISLSDGETKVTITLKAVGSDGSAPNFALDGASLVRLEQSGDGSWMIEALPNKDVYQASLTVIDSQAITEYPLTVAPKVAVKTAKPGAAPTEKDFTAFLKGKGAENNPAFDLDGDGKRTHIDDYIYTLNYIVGSKLK